MGLYFNTLATTEMLQKINNAFGPGNIDYWKQRRYLFGPIPPGATLASIAGQAGLFPGAGWNSPAGKRWQKWLGDLESTTPIRSILYTALDPSGKCAEIVFVVVPKANMPITVGTSTITNSDGTYSLTVTINTPTASVVRAAIKSKSKTRKKS